MSGEVRFRQEEIQDLPRWARLAFGVRCVRRARRLLEGPEESVKVIDRAIALVEQACRKGQADEQLADAAAAAYTFALNAVEHGGDEKDEDDALIVTCTVAHAAAFAAEAATIAAARMAAYLAAQSVDFAIQAHLVAGADLGDAIAAMREDLERVQEGVAREGWGNLTPMKADLLGPL